MQLSPFCHGWYIAIDGLLLPMTFDLPAKYSHSDSIEVSVYEQKLMLQSEHNFGSYQIKSTRTF
jgi:hypothetical protein